VVEACQLLNDHQFSTIAFKDYEKGRKNVLPFKARIATDRECSGSDLFGSLHAPGLRGSSGAPTSHSRLQVNKVDDIS